MARSSSWQSLSPLSFSFLPSAGSLSTSSTASLSSAPTARNRCSSPTLRSSSLTATQPSTPSFMLSVLRNSALRSRKSGNYTCFVRIQSVQEGARGMKATRGGWGRSTVTMMTCDLWKLIGFLSYSKSFTLLDHRIKRLRLFSRSQGITGQKKPRRHQGMSKTWVKELMELHFRLISFICFNFRWQGRQTKTETG